MNSTLPDFSAGCTAPSATSSTALAELTHSVGSSVAHASDAPPEFAALLPAAPVPPAESGSATAPAQQDGLINFTAPSIRTMSAAAKPVPTSIVLGKPAAPALEHSARLAAAAQALSPVAVGPAVAAGCSCLASAGEVSVVAQLTEPAAARRLREIPRETFEQAAAMATTLLHSLLPEVTLPPMTVGAGSAELRSRADPSAQPSLLPEGGMPRAHYSVAADGAIELKLQFPPSPAFDSKAEPSTATSFQLRAELPLSGEATLRLAATGFTPAGGSAPGMTPVGQENIAGPISSGKFKREWSDLAPEIKFVFTGDKQVKSLLPAAGITVAKTGSTMPAALIEEPRPTRKPEQVAGLLLRADFPGALPPAERLSDQVAAPAAQNFAERAVETVTNLVEAQFSANMQKSGSVQLRFQFGGEDLRIRVELRDGTVHTDFRTDSPELRNALSREWPTATAHASEHSLRYLDPVFSTGPAPTSAQADAQQYPARHQQSQQDSSPRSHRENPFDSLHPFSRRSQLNDTFIPEPATAHGPVRLPTSSRLSVHA